MYPLQPLYNVISRWTSMVGSGLTLLVTYETKHKHLSSCTWKDSWRLFRKTVLYRLNCVFIKWHSQQRWQNTAQIKSITVSKDVIFHHCTLSKFHASKYMVWQHHCNVVAFGDRI